MNTPRPAPPRAVLHAVAAPVDPEVTITVMPSGTGWAWVAEGTRKFHDTGAAETSAIASLAALDAAVSQYRDAPGLRVRLVGGDEVDEAAQFAAQHLERVKILRFPTPKSKKTRPAKVTKRDLVIARRGHIEVATDASMESGIGRGNAGWSWVNAKGEFSTGRVDFVTVTAAELWAITMAAVDHRGADSVRVLSDCQRAVKIARMIVNGEPLPPYLPVHPSRVHAVTRRLRSVSCPLTIDWIPGHSGHDLNEAADRLAKHARWSAANGATPSEVEDYARSIVTALVRAD